MDGVTYNEWRPPDEATLEGMVKEHHKDIFGNDSMYFDFKSKISGNSVVAIPDGYVITFNPPQWWLVEVELSSHDVYGHIQPQIGKFIAAINQTGTKNELATKLFEEIKADKHMELNLQRQKGTEIYKFLSDLLREDPKIAIAIDRKVPALDDIAKVLHLSPKIIEFATFCREGTGDVVHVHMFEPLSAGGTLPPATGHGPQGGNVSHRGTGSIESSKLKGFDEILEVATLVYSGKSFGQATKEVAEHKGRTEGTVRDACTRRLGIDTEEFQRLLEDRSRLIAFLANKFGIDIQSLEQRLK